MNDADVEPRVLDLLLELVGADEARPHAGFADEYDELHLVSALTDHDDTFPLLWRPPAGPE
jgi:hypothetical protein